AAASTGRGTQIGLWEPEAHPLTNIGWNQGQRDKFAKVLTAAPVSAARSAGDWPKRTTGRIGA
ncbi:MAG: hypothetical protein K0S78_3328, partial [Thermomicrobiales bacterium]|nr:hypothetical protein [Thermomicrobiales bacterium]